VAVVYAIMMTRDEDLSWQMRAIRVLPMFVLPAVSSVIYSTVVSFTRMRKCPPCQITLFLTLVIPVFSLLLVCKISRGLIFPFVLPFVKFVCSAWTLVSGRFTSVLEICVWYFQNSYNMNLAFVFLGCCSISSLLFMYRHFEIGGCWN